MLIRFGLTVLAIAVVAVLISEFKLNGVVTREAVFAAYFSLAIIAVGLVLRTANKMRRAVAHPRCGRCDRIVDKGRIYCAEHSRVQPPRPRSVGRGFDKGTIPPSS